MAAVAGCVQRVVEPPDDFGGLDVRRVLIAEGAALNTDDEAEVLHLLGEFRERKGDRLVLVEVRELECLEVADEEVARFVTLWERIEVLERLVAGSREVPPGALLLDEQDSGPEQIDEAVAVVELLDVRFIAGNATSTYVEDFEEFVVEALRVRLLVGSVLPFAREGGGPGAYLVP